MRTKRQCTHFHTFGLDFFLLPLSLPRQLLCQRTPSYWVMKVIWRLKVILTLIYSSPFYCVGQVAELAGRPTVQWSNNWASQSCGLGFFLAVPYHFVAVAKPQFSHLPNGDNNSSSCSLVTVQWRHLAQGPGPSVCSINVSSIRFAWVKGERPLRAGGSLSSSLESSGSARIPARGCQGGLVFTGTWGSAFIPKGSASCDKLNGRAVKFKRVSKQCILNSLS